MKGFLAFLAGGLLFAFAGLPAQAAFTGLFIFGDCLSTTNDNTSGLPYYYGKRYSNGRVWVEVLAQRQGLTISNDWSYFDDNSADTLANVKSFTLAPSVASNALFIVWVCNSDTYDAASAATPLTFAQWQAANALAQTNQLQIITNLYGKGVRTLIMPNAVDLSEVPAFDAGSLSPTIHAGCVDYNTKFTNTVARARTLCTNLTIYTPDFFTLLNNVLSNAAGYDGLTNAISGGHSASAAETITGLTMTNNPGTNYIYWDQTDPSAKFHEIIGDVAQQMISPVRISAITMLKNSNRLDVVNYPAGLNGFVDACTNLVQRNWTAALNLAGTNTTWSVFCPLSVAPQFYRLRFPYSWCFP